MTRESIPLTPDEQALVDLAGETDRRVVGAYVHARGERRLLVIELLDADAFGLARLMGALRQHRDTTGSQVQFVVVHTTTPTFRESMPRGWPPEGEQG